MIPFTNERLTDFSYPDNALVMQATLDKVARQLGGSYSLVIGGKQYQTDQQFLSLNPCLRHQTVGAIAQGDSHLAEAALLSAWQAFGAWRNTSFSARADYLFRLAALIRRQKAELSAWIVFEVGKNWREADADVAEAIDFCEYYGRQALELAQGGRVVPMPGERNQLLYTPLGAGVIIAPWNFPLAILVGMTCAAIVCGNTVVIKPANVGGVVAAKAFALMQEAGIPDGVVNYLPGDGLEVGEYLVKHPLTRFINFTGSQAVGLRINQQAAVTQPGQKWIKRVVAEMGGKDCIIVDETADLEAAAAGIASSAFGFQGQKCSACSRAIVTAPVYEEVLERVASMTRLMSFGSAVDNHDLTAVIDNLAFAKISSYLTSANERLVLGGEFDDSVGYYIRPTIYADVEPTARLAQEEIFGPVLAFIKARDYAEALSIGNHSLFGLTAAVYSGNRERWEQAKQDLHVGNLYYNRGCTGAFVGVHPFGGFNMSGTDSKAGGPDYLQLFTQAKTVAERL